MEVRVLPTRPLPDRLTAGQRPLTPRIVVRVHVWQPASFVFACGVVATATRPAVNRKDPGSNPGPTAKLHPVVARRGRSAMPPPFERNHLVRLQPTGPLQASSKGRTSGRLPQNRGSNPRAWTTSTKCCRNHGAVVRRRRGFDSRRRLHSDQRASVVIALDRSPRERGSIPRLVTTSTPRLRWATTSPS